MSERSARALAHFTTLPEIDGLRRERHVVADFIVVCSQETRDEKINRKNIKFSEFQENILEWYSKICIL